MASKRNSHVYVDEAKHREEGQQKGIMPSRSRRDSRSSVKDDEVLQFAKDIEDAQRANITASESSAASTSSASSTSSVSRSHSINSTSWEPTKEGPVRQQAEAMKTPAAVAATHPLDSIPGSDSRPANFGLVIPGVYRSSYPKPSDYAFLQNLKLKTVVTLVKKDELDHDLNAFTASNGIRQVIFNMKGTKKESIPMYTMKSILELVLDRQNYPLLIHCNHGKHRTGCVVAVVRKLSGWATGPAIAEYESYAEPKVRECDVEYISSFQTSALSLTSGTARPSRLHARTFFRAFVFSALVLAVWLVSSARLAPPAAS
ncbi:tyrosine phosphatase [Purpureocillium lavendulum]|uniref:diphosphoinositol-polyphosphate diphosphatase n=1 Tax=Purpureocillium lavendulum TaxID=1247861 RepID=A0AB34FL38_9HYPO|nr:tyrosine phosphatase [Purpureocillium lavendulum]